jgi:hypothetical protein
MSSGLLDPSGLLDWLSRLALDHDGAVPSWRNPGHPGYAYPEAAGLLLTALAQARPDDPALAVTARWLEAQVDERGLVGRAGLGHAFDTAIALTGLLSARRAGVAVRQDRLRRMLSALLAAIAGREAVDAPEVPQRWSTRWSCHQLKLVWALVACEQELGEPSLRPAIDHAIASLAELLVLEHAGRFAIAGDDPRSYVHASCYALEGVLALARRGVQAPEQWARLRRGGDWLASLQAEDGSFPAWVGDGEELERRPSDVIAQALRLWSALDRSAYAEPIERARAALARRWLDGGVRYVDDGADINSWCTAFTAQALRWAAGEGEGEWIA